MSSGTDNPAYGRFSTFFIQRAPRSAHAPWPHNAKVVLWVGLALASWSAVISGGYFLWSAL
jgi:hypothetical protein